MRGVTHFLRAIWVAIAGLFGMSSSVVLFALLAISFTYAQEPPAEKAPLPKLLVPAYFYPAEQGLKNWQSLIAASKTAEITAIVNPASGPGKAVDPLYAKIIKNRGELKLIGYVPVNYGKRPAKEVLEDVDRWRKMYPGIQGIFLDEQPSSKEQIAAFLELCEQIRKVDKTLLIVGNPGVICDLSYFAETGPDVICVFENSKSLEAYDAAPLAKVNASRKLALLHSTANKSLAEQLTLAQGKGFGHVYITDDLMPNPWDKLPSYWKSEVQALSPKAATSAPPSLKKTSAEDLIEALLSPELPSSEYTGFPRKRQTDDMNAHISKVESIRNELQSRGVAAVPTLMAHLDDDRFSRYIATSVVIPHSIGGECRWMLNAILDPPAEPDQAALPADCIQQNKGFFSRIGKDGQWHDIHANYLFLQFAGNSKAAQQWWQERKFTSIPQVHLHAVQFYIRQEEAIGFPAGCDGEKYLRPYRELEAKLKKELR